MPRDAQKEAVTEESSSGVPGWVVPAGLVAAGAAIAAAYFAGFVPDSAIAVLLAAAFGLTLAAIAIKSGFDSSNPRLRAASIAYAALTLVATLYPAKTLLMPGTPEAQASIDTQHPSVQLPHPGAYRLVVGSDLGQGSETRVDYWLQAGGEDVHGTLERVHARRRVGRRGSVDVTEDHNMAAHEVTVKGDAPAVTLQSMQGGFAGEHLTLRAYSILPPSMLYALMGLLLAGAMLLEGRLNARGGFAGAGTAAICFALLVRSANPAATLGPVMGSALLGAGGGALGGSVLSALARKIFGRRAATPAAATPDAAPTRRR